jgi:hypothetical protein
VLHEVDEVVELDQTFGAPGARAEVRLDLSGVSSGARTDRISLQQIVTGMTENLHGMPSTI